VLIHPGEVLSEARRGGWAVGGFNAYNLESARAVVRAAERARAPVMVQTSHGAVAHGGMAELVAIVSELARAATVPVALHLDHGKDPALTRAAIDAGYSSVMIDASALPLEENIATTRAIVEAARPRGVQVEAEIGTLAGIEDLGDSDTCETLTRPRDAQRFAEETGVDSLAVAVGTAHGAVKFSGEPRIDFARLEAIAALVEQPLVLHGASAIDADEVARAEALGARFDGARGLPPELIRGAIERGVAKVNTDSDLRLSALTRLREVLGERPDLFNVYELMGELEEAIGETTERRIRLFGSAGCA
jgi:fructose-bisphosphate aldolase class II